MLPIAPLAPTPAYPTDNTLHVPANFTLRWNSGVDATRRYPWWPVTYAIYYKAWNYGAAEPASYFFFEICFQCNADFTLSCTQPAPHLAAGHYSWYSMS